MCREFSNDQKAAEAFISLQMYKRISPSNLFVEFLQSSLLLSLCLFQLVDGLFECLLVFLRILQTQAKFTVLLAQSGSFSLGLIEFSSQPSHLSVEGELCL